MASAEENGRLEQDARLSATLRYGGGVSAEQMEFYKFQRIAALHLADEMHIPQTGDEELKKFILGLRLFQGTDGQFDSSRYDSFRTSVRGGGVASEPDITRVLKDDVRINKIELYLGGPGYVMPRDVTQVLVKGDTSWTVSTATVDYAAFDPGITVTDADIAKFFSSNSSRYTIPPPGLGRLRINFPASDYSSAQVTTHRCRGEAVLQFQPLAVSEAGGGQGGEGGPRGGLCRRGAAGPRRPPDGEGKARSG